MMFNSNYRCYKMEIEGSVNDYIYNGLLQHKDNSFKETFNPDRKSVV